MIAVGSDFIPPIERGVVVLVTVLGGVVFGLALAAPPGPMNAVIATESAVRGWGAGFRAGLGAMTADACFLLLALGGLVAIVDRSPTARALLFAIGGLLMVYFAYGAVADARSLDAGGTENAGHTTDVSGTDETDPSATTDETGGGFRKAFVLAITNPFQIAFWLTIGVGLLEVGHIDVLAPLPLVGERLAGTAIVRTGHPLLLVGFFGGILVWIVGFPAAVVAARRRIEATAPIVAWLSAVVLAGSGVLFLAEALARLPAGPG